MNRSYYYERVAQKAQLSSPEQQELEPLMVSIFEQHKHNYGSRRMMKELHKKGIIIGRHRVRTLMKRLGLTVQAAQRFKVTTDSKHTYPIAPNRLDRQFSVASPNQVWTTDISYVWTNERWMYLAIVVDLFSRQIVGWSIQDHMKT